MAQTRLSEFIQRVNAESSAESVGSGIRAVTVLKFPDLVVMADAHNFIARVRDRQDPIYCVSLESVLRSVLRHKLRKVTARSVQEWLTGMEDVYRTFSIQFGEMLELSPRDVHGLLRSEVAEPPRAKKVTRIAMKRITRISRLM